MSNGEKFLSLCDFDERQAAQESFYIEVVLDALDMYDDYSIAELDIIRERLDRAYCELHFDGCNDYKKVCKIIEGN